MKKIFIFFVIFSLSLLFSFGFLYAKKAEKLVKVGAVDLQKVFEASPGKQVAKEQLDKKREQFENEKKKKEEKIKELQDEFERKKYTMDDNEKEKKGLEIRALKIELKEFINKSNETLIAEEDKLLEPLVDDIKDVIRAVSIKYGYDIILDKSTYILFIDKEYDITQEVLNELKVKYKK